MDTPRARLIGNPVVSKVSGLAGLHACTQRCCVLDLDVEAQQQAGRHDVVTRAQGLGVALMSFMPLPQPPFQRVAPAVPRPRPSREASEPAARGTRQSPGHRAGWRRR